MKAPLTLRRPSNWQDFETLCKVLWGEIWNCPEIKKNGRNGQAQHGIDISGNPFGGNDYYGIQCKGKNEYTNNQFTEKEITKEIENAKNFKPPLKKLYFATTAEKDVKIEEFVRIKNIENKTKGLFEVHIFAWADIVELIDENKQTHAWYVKSQNFKTTKSISVTFQDDSKEIILIPKFQKTITHYNQKIIPADTFYVGPLSGLMSLHSRFSNLGHIAHTSFFDTTVNLSYCSFHFKIHNTGSDPIEEFKLLFDFDCDIQDLAETNEKGNELNFYPRTIDISFKSDLKAGEIIPFKKILVGDDTYTSDNIFIKPFNKNYEIKINWRLLSKDYKEHGELKITIQPDIEFIYKDILVEDPTKVRIIESEIEDMIVDKKDTEQE